MLFLVRGPCLIASVALSAFASGAVAAEFPRERELLLDAAPMRPSKRMPSITVNSDGSAIVDLWCKSVAARVVVTEADIRIAADPLPDALPAMIGPGQCSPERMRADETLLEALSQVTTWRAEEGAVVLAGPATLRFQAGTN